MIGRVSRSAVTVLVTGETGAGKQGVAHARSRGMPHSDPPNITVNCSAIPTNLLEFELHGDAEEDDRAEDDRLRQADGDTPIALRIRLLRALQQHADDPAGQAPDVRLIATAHCDLRQTTQRGGLGQDPCYRLNVFPFEVPPMRQCLDQLVQFVEHGRQVLRDNWDSCPRLSRKAVELLQQHQWPGKLKELSQLLHRMGLLFAERAASVSDLTQQPRQRQPQPEFSQRLPNQLLQQRSLDLDQDPVLPAAGDGCKVPDYLRRREMVLIRQALVICDDDTVRAARLLNLRPTSLLEKMRAYNIEGGLRDRRGFG